MLIPHFGADSGSSRSARVSSRSHSAFSNASVSGDSSSDVFSASEAMLEAIRTAEANEESEGHSSDDEFIENWRTCVENEKPGEMIAAGEELKGYSRYRKQQKEQEIQRIGERFYPLGKLLHRLENGAKNITRQVSAQLKDYGLSWRDYLKEGAISTLKKGVQALEGPQKPEA